MPLHLAHHKSYHPYNRTNIERVQRDEAIAALAEAQQHSSSFNADDQARLTLLRKQAAKEARGAGNDPANDATARLKAAEREVLHGKRGELAKHDERLQQRLGSQHDSAAAASATTASDRMTDNRGHINFWAQQERNASLSRSKASAQGQNPEYLKEQEEARQKFEERVSFSLGRPAKELRPWYTSSDLQNGEESKKTEDQKLEAAYKDNAIKSSSDPLKAMESFLSKRKQALEKQKEQQQRQKDDAGSRPHGGGSQLTRGFDDSFNDEYSDLYNREAVRAAREARNHEHRSEEGSKLDRGNRALDFEHEHQEGLGDKSNSSGSSSSSSSRDDPTSPSPFGENPYRPGSRASMYPELFQQMICTVLESESYLFSNAELDLLSSFFMLSYAARYLFVRLLQRKRDAWYRLDRLTAYEQEIGDLRPAKEELSCAISTTPDDVPKVEHARREEESRRLEAMQEDKENVVLTLPGLQRNMHLDERTGLLTPFSSLSAMHGKQPFGPASSNADVKTQGTAATIEAGCPNEASMQNRQRPLSRFVLVEKDMQGGAEESMSLLTLDELKALAKKLNIIKIGTTRSQIISALLATKCQATLFGSVSPKNKAGATKEPRQLTLSFGSSGKKTAQTNRLQEELAEVLQGGCIQVVPEVRSLVDRVALVYYRGNLLGSAALTAAILSRSRRRNYPLYGFRRSPFLFPSRDHLVAFERALDIEARMEQLIQFGKTEQDHREALELFESVYQEWQDCVEECKLAHPDGIDKRVYHRMRFHPGWILSRVVYKGAACLARFKLHDREKEVLSRLLDQKVFRRGRRGDWYDRLALITALYSADAKKGKKEALQISIRGIQDPDTHLIYHDTLQRRIARLESQLRIPRSEQHDFSYAKLKRSTEVVFKGVRLDGMLNDENRPTSPSTTMSSFLLKRRSSSPSPSKVLKRSASDKGLRGSPLKDGGHSPSEGPASGFQVRRPLYKRVKVEEFALAGGSTSAGRQSPVVQGEKAATALRKSPQDEVDPKRTLSQPFNIKREDSNDALEDALAQEGALDDDDASLLNLGLPISTDSPISTRKETRTSMRSVWRGLDHQPCHVEQLCLQHYAREGFKGVHCEGKILTMLFALVMWDVLFRDDVAGAFETPYQAAPLDLGSDAFSIVRSVEIRERLDEIEQTGGLHLIAEADDAQRERKTWAIGCRWDLFSKQDLLEVAECLGGHSIAVICQMFCEEWEHCTGGMPDLCIWRMSDKTCRFVEVKGPGDRLSETQKVWIDVLLRAGVDVQVGLVVEG